MSEISASECRRCGGRIYWHKSKNDKPYPCDSADDRRNFHACTGSSTGAVSGGAKVAPATPAPTPAPRTAPIEASLAERVTHLEKQVGWLYRKLQEQETKRPITDSDVGF